MLRKRRALLQNEMVVDAAKEPDADKKAASRWGSDIQNILFLMPQATSAAAALFAGVNATVDSPQ